MINDLPTPIAAYAAANACLDTDGMLASFAPDAVVRDDGGRHTGHDEIRAWINSATIAAKAVFTPEAWRKQDGHIIVEGPTAGDFPGSPIRFIFQFTLRDGAIAGLDVA
ncbi:nuclear transport factor 2 family protein [Belnapia sp. T6]|uniref:Nuclear transport factor 2 family protein n=1 Tax=Belnapia mucosa TaxID=2804532 RepID=A0ABS1VB99_9PROT|nr:nuclear transport factor 2 family protein [Belnapia mucosa]MBL6458956.1 nuclear transport factor 2 family protein [Belnapia mucosa]